jgi:hypothetical protein
MELSTSIIWMTNYNIVEIKMKEAWMTIEKNLNLIDTELKFQPHKLNKTF